MNWFSNGVNFECKSGCGACCTAPLTDVDEYCVNITLDEARAIYKEYFSFPEGFSQKAFLDQRTLHLPNGRRTIRFVSLGNGVLQCPFLDFETKLCEVHEIKPHQCRTFPFWRDAFHSKEVWDSLAVRCPGINDGPLITEEEILSKLKDRKVAKLQFYLGEHER